MVISHNLLAMNANRQLNLINNRKNKITEKLSSGYRINRSADDAAGLAISEKMRRQIRGLTQASLNCQDGVSLCQVADGALAEIHDMLDRCSELSIKAANGTLTSEDRNYIGLEINQIKEEIDAIKEKVTFNGIEVLKGKEAVADTTTPTIKGGLPTWVTVDGGGSLNSQKTMDKTINIGGNSYRGSTFDFSALNTSNVSELTQSNSGFYTTCCTCSNHYSFTFTDTSSNNFKQSGDHYIFEIGIKGVTTGSDLVSRIENAVGNNPAGHYTKLEFVGDKLHVYDKRPDRLSASVSSPYGQIGPGVAYGKESIAVAPDIIIQAGSENDESQQIKIKLPGISCSLLNISATSVSSESLARNAIAAFKNAKSYVSLERSRMGAYQNRLEHTINNLNNVVENTTAAESQIRDTDMAKLMVEYARDNILQNAAQAMLAQANQSSQGILSLLQ